MISMEALLASGLGVVTAAGVYLLLRARTYPVVLGLSLIGYAVIVFIFEMGRLWTNANPILAGEGPVTAAELDPVRKNRESHRGQALRALVAALAGRPESA